MTGRCLSGLIVAVALAAFVGCGKKSSSQSSTEPSNSGPIAGGPGPIGPGGKDKKEQPKPTYETYIADMKTYAGKQKTGSTPSGQQTLTLLTENVPPTHERRAEVYKALLETAEKLPIAEKAQYVLWATRYAGPENAADLLAIARAYSSVELSGTCKEAFKRLVELKEPSTFAPIAAMLNDSAGLLRLESAKALKGIGASAEKAVQPYAGPIGPGGKANDFLLRVKAIEILGDIGTADSIPLLQSAGKDTNSTIASGAATALAAIQARKK
jgi:hypothetical protein